MKCNNCNQVITDDSKYCKYCGKEVSDKFSLDIIPKGFTFDKASGWYHKIELKRSKKGPLQQEITYFNPEKNHYLKELSKTHSSYNEEESPIGKVSDYLYDEVSEVYYLTKITADIKTGEKIQKVSYFFPKKREFININYLISQPETIEKWQEIEKKALKVKEKHKEEAVISQPEETNKLKKKKTKSKKQKMLKAVSIFFAIFAILLGLYYTLVWTKVIPYGSLEYLAMSAKENIMALPARIEHAIQKSNDDEWPNFSHVSSYYKNAIEIGADIYFIAPYQKNKTIYKYDYENANITPFVIPNESESRIEAFTISHGYIYYGATHKNDTDASYYRMDLKTQTKEFLFSTDVSGIVARGNNIYIFSSSNNRLRVLDVLSDTPKIYTEILIETKSEHSYILSNSFSVYKNSLYYAELADGNYYYYKLGLKNSKKEELLSDNKFKQINPMFIDNKTYYTKIDTTLQEASFVASRNRKEVIIAKFPITDDAEPYYLATAIIKDYFLYSNNTGFSLEKNGEVTTYETSDKVISVTENWIILENSIYHVDSATYVPIEGNDTEYKENDTDGPASIEDISSGMNIMDYRFLEISVEIASISEKEKLTSVDILPYFGLYINEESIKLQLIDENNELAFTNMSNLLWEAFSSDYITFENLVKEGQVKGFFYQGEKIFFDEAELDNSLEFFLEHADNEKSEEGIIMQKIILTTNNSRQRYIVEYSLNDNPAICQYKILSVEKYVDKN